MYWVAPVTLAGRSRRPPCCSPPGDTDKIALVFTLGLVYGTFIFEQTGLCLTLEEIYNILPKNKQTKYGYKTFQKRYFIDGTSSEISKILFSNI